MLENLAFKLLHGSMASHVVPSITIFQGRLQSSMEPTEGIHRSCREGDSHHLCSITGIWLLINKGAVGAIIHDLPKNMGQQNPFKDGIFGQDW